MNDVVLANLLPLVPTSLIFIGSVSILYKTRNVSSVLQMIGASCLFALALGQIVQSLHLVRSTKGIDLLLVILGLTCFPVGYMFHGLEKRRG